MRIQGIDPSLTRTGIAILDSDDRSIVCSSVITKPAVIETVSTRFRRIRDAACDVMDGGEDPSAFPDFVVIEGNAISSRDGKVWDRAGLWWNIIEICETFAIPYAVCPPNTRAKWATGRGNAPKDEVGIAVDRLWPDRASNNDERDALAFVTIGAQWLGWPVPTLARHLAALPSIEWPMPGDGLDALQRLSRAAVPGSTPLAVQHVPGRSRGRTGAARGAA